MAHIENNKVLLASGVVKDKIPSCVDGWKAACESRTAHARHQQVSQRRPRALDGFVQRVEFNSCRRREDCANEVF